MLLRFLKQISLSFTMSIQVNRATSKVLGKYHITQS